MKITLNNFKTSIGILAFMLLLIIPLQSIEAQRFGHRASRGGGRSMSRPSPSRNVSKPKTTPSKRRIILNKPSTPKDSLNRIVEIMKPVFLIS